MPKLWAYHLHYFDYGREIALLHPDPASPEAATRHARALLALGLAAGYATVQPIGAVTVGPQGERLAELGAMARSRARSTPRRWG